MEFASLESLRNEITEYCQKRFLGRAKIFHDIPMDIVKSIMSRFKVEQYLPNDVVSFNSF